MKLIDRCIVEGTTPRIYIGHREYRKPNGQIYISRTWYAEYCYEAKHQYEALGVTNKQQAIRKAHEINNRINEGLLKPKKFKLTTDELRDQYLEVKKNQNRAPKTLTKYTYGLHEFADWSRGQGIDSAVRFTSRDFWKYNQWMSGHNKKEKAQYDRLILVKQAFKWAKKEKLIPENPLDGIEVPEPAPRPQPCFTEHQVATLLQNADPHEAAIFATMAYQGLRFGEVRDLRWSDILSDVGEHGFVVVQRGGSGSKTKNRKIRRIPLNPELKPHLANISKKFERIFTARPSKKHPQGGSPISERRLLVSLKRLCKRCGFENPKQYKLHTFRHAFASMCARNQISYKYALDWMGHSSSEILDLYYTMYDEVADNAPVRGSILRRKVPAKQIEGAVLDAIEQVLQQIPDLRTRLVSTIERQVSFNLKDNEDRQRLLLEQQAVKEEYRLLIGSIGKHGKELAQQKIRQLEAQLDSFESRLAAADSAAGKAIRPEDHADRIMGTLKEVHSGLRNMPPALLVRMASTLISKLEVDLETLDFELELGLPKWALVDADRLERAMRPATNLHMKTGSQTPNDFGLILGTFSCGATKRPVCFSCRRRAA